MPGKNKHDWVKQLIEREYRMKEYADKVDKQEKEISQLEVDLKDKTKTLNTMKQSNKIQIGVIIAIIISAGIGFIVNSVAIAKQGEFNRNAFRPWIYVEPRKPIEVKDGRAPHGDRHKLLKDEVGGRGLTLMK